MGRRPLTEPVDGAPIPLSVARGPGAARAGAARVLGRRRLPDDFPTVLENGWSIERPDWWVVQVPVHALRFDTGMRDRLED